MFEVEKLDLYNIELKNMRKDLCEYNFSLDDQFFALIEAPEIHKGHLDVVLTVKKSYGAFVIDFAIQGEVAVMCDRCLDDMFLPVDTVDSIKVKLGEEYDETEDLVIVPESDGYINIAWNIYEFALLSLPMVHVHPEGECNEEMITALNSHLATNANEFETDGDEEQPAVDPRWNELKKILNNN